MKRDPLVFGALVAVLVVLASAEYELARACGFGKYVAAGVPAALDIYAIKALRSKRDVLVVVAALIAVNGASHLVASGLLPVDWPLIVAVSAIAPLVLWRVHRLSEEPSVVQQTTEAEADRGADATVAERYGDPVVTRRRPDVVPAGADFLPIVSRIDPAEITIEREPPPPPPPARVPVLGPFRPIGELAATPVAPPREPVALLSVADVAQAAGVAEGTVRSWVSRNKLTPVQRDEGGRLLFHPDAVAALN